MLPCLHAMDSSDSTLVQHLLTSWWPALQFSLFHPRTCISNEYTFNRYNENVTGFLPEDLRGKKTIDLEVLRPVIQSGIVSLSNVWESSMPGLRRNFSSLSPPASPTVPVCHITKSSYMFILAFLTTHQLCSCYAWGRSDYHLR